MQEMCAAPSQSPQARILTGVVVHAVLTFLVRESTDILRPFIKMLNTPGELKVLNKTSGLNKCFSKKFIFIATSYSCTVVVNPGSLPTYHA